MSFTKIAYVIQIMFKASILPNHSIQYLRESPFSNVTQGSCARLSEDKKQWVLKATRPFCQTE